MIVRRSMGRSSAERGGALVAMTLVAAVLATVSVGVVSMSLSGHKERQSAQEDIHARYVAQAGLANAVYEVQRGATGNLGSPQYPVTWDQSEFYVTRTTLAGGEIQLTATGLDDRKGARMELVMRQVPSTSYRYGAFGREWFHLDSNAHVDSYDSTVGTYALQATNGSGTNMYANLEGDIGSNGPITIDQNAKVWGDAPSGPGQSTSVLGNAVVTGSTAAATSMQTVPNVSVPSLASLGNLTVSSNTTIPTGSRRYGTFTVNSNKVVTITGPATIVCTNFELKSNSSFIVDQTNGPVTFYCIDNFKMGQNTVMRSSNYDPHMLSVNLLSDNVFNPETNVTLDNVDMLSNTQLYGTVLAPDARIVINSNFQLFGSIVARSMDLHSNSFIHFDESLTVLTEIGAPDWDIMSWRTLPYTP